VDEINSYCEISASGTGLHVVCRGTLPEDFHFDPKEIYSGNSGKLIAMTGDILGFNTRIEDRQEQVEKLLERWKAEAGIKKADAKPTLQDEIIVRCMADVEEQDVQWLWPNRIPLSAVTLFSGNADTGKTTAYLDIAARVSSGRNFPDATIPEGAGGLVLIMADEDDYTRVIKPRLMAADADLNSIFFIEKVEIQVGAKREQRMFALDQDLAKLERLLQTEQLYSLIIIDPISSYFGKGNMNSKQDVRTVFSRITELCETFRLAVIGVEHFNKRVDLNAKQKIGGSVALIAAARSAFMFAPVPDEEGQNVMHFIKGNYSKRKVGLRFTIEEKHIASKTVKDPVPYIVWGAEDASTADDLLQAEKQPTESKGKRGLCAAWLKQQLANGDVRSSKIYDLAAGQFSPETIKRVVADEKNGIWVDRRAGHWWMTMSPRPGTTVDGDPNLTPDLA
jgi:putative DNA primase/helicase